MADTKGSALSVLLGKDTASVDELIIIDKSDTTMGVGGTNKKTTLGELALANASVPAKAILKTDGTNYTLFDGPTGAIQSTTTDVDAAFASAIAHLTAARTSKEKIVAVGDFPITAKIVLENYTTLDLSAASLSPTSGWTIADLAMVTNELFAGVVGTNNKFIDVVGGYFDGTEPDTLNVFCSAVKFVNIENYSITNIHSYWSGATAIYIGDGKNGLIQNNICDQNGDDGITLQDATQNTVVDGNTCSNGRSDHGGASNGIEIENESGGADTAPSHLVVSNNICFSNPQNGINSKTDGVSACFSYSTIANNICYENTINGILLNGKTSTDFVCESLYLEGNVCHNNSSIGIKLQNCNNSSIMGGSCDNNATQGVRLVNCNGIQIGGGLITAENESNGIHVESDCNNVNIGAVTSRNNYKTGGGSFIYGVEIEGSNCSVGPGTYIIDDRVDGSGNRDPEMRGIRLKATTTNLIIDGVVFDGVYHASSSTKPGPIYKAVMPDTPLVNIGITWGGTSGWAVGDTFLFENGDGTGASAIVTEVSAGVIANAVIVNGGTGFTVAPTQGDLGDGVGVGKPAVWCEIAKTTVKNVKTRNMTPMVTEGSGIATGMTTGDTIPHGLFFGNGNALSESNSVTELIAISQTAGNAVTVVTIDDDNITVAFTGGSTNASIFWSVKAHNWKE